MAETSGRDTKEYRAIQHHYATVIHTLAKTVNPALFAGRLLEKSLISEGKLIKVRRGNSEHGVIRNGTSNFRFIHSEEVKHEHATVN